jgi:hypothetical protein
MTELEQYIRSHAEEFDVKEPAQGHEERFLARLEEAQKPARRPWRVVWGTVAAAAALSALFVVNAVRRNSPEAIYLTYMDRVSQLYSACPADAGTDWDDTLASLTEEATPLFLQLPEEMSRLEKARILRAHYASLLEGAKQLANQ